MPSPDADLPEVVQVARDLIRFDTTNHGGGRAVGEREAAEYVGAYLSAHGLTPEFYEPIPRRTNVMARVPGRNRDKPALVLHGHLDVVPAIAEDWSVDPFAGEIRDGMLWGRGAVDMKDMDAMILTSVAGILRSGEPARARSRPGVLRRRGERRSGGVGPRRDRTGRSGSPVPPRRSARSADTPSPSPAGAHICCRSARRPWSGSGWSRAGPGSARVELPRRQRGDQARRRRRGARPHRVAGHASPPRRARWSARLGELMGEASDDPDALAAATGAASGFLRATLRTTTNPTGLTAGYKHNVIPDRAEALIDVRTLPGTEQETLADIRRIVGRRGRGRDRPPGHRPRSAVRGRPRRCDGRERCSATTPRRAVIPYLMGGGTDNKALAYLGIAGYGFAPLRLPADLDFTGMFHGVDERVPLDALVFGQSVLTDLLRTY